MRCKTYYHINFVIDDISSGLLELNCSGQHCTVFLKSPSCKSNSRNWMDMKWEGGCGRRHVTTKLYTYLIAQYDTQGGIYNIVAQFWDRMSIFSMSHRAMVAFTKSKIILGRSPNWPPVFCIITPHLFDAFLRHWTNAVPGNIDMLKGLEGGTHLPANLCVLLVQVHLYSWRACKFASPIMKTDQCWPWWHLYHISIILSPSCNHHLLNPIPNRQIK